MSAVYEYRMRFWDNELEFMVFLLEEMEESTLFIRSLCSDLKRKHRKDWIRTNYNKANKEHSEMVRRLIAIRSLKHRFQGTFEGGKPRGSKICEPQTENY